MKRLFFIQFLFVLSFILFTDTFLAAETADDKPGSFRRAFIQIDDNGNISPVEQEIISQKVLKTNYQVFFRPMRDAYLYVLLFGPGDDLVILFPGSFTVFEKAYETFSKYIPENDSLLHVLKNPGKYELHFLVAENRLVRLEKLIGDYRSIMKKKNSYYPGLKIRKDIQYEIRRIKRKHFLPDRIKIKLVKEAGTRRRDDEIIIKTAESISFEDLYAEIFFLENE